MSKRLFSDGQCHYFGSIDQECQISQAAALLRASIAAPPPGALPSTFYPSHRSSTLSAPAQPLIPGASRAPPLQPTPTSGLVSTRVGHLEGMALNSYFCMKQMAYSHQFKADDYKPHQFKKFAHRCTGQLFLLPVRVEWLQQSIENFQVHINLNYTH